MFVLSAARKYARVHAAAEVRFGVHVTRIGEVKPAVDVNRQLPSSKTTSACGFRKQHEPPHSLATIGPYTLSADEDKVVQ